MGHGYRPMLAISLLFYSASPVFATQGHGAPEGLYIHQISHVFFSLSMAMLIYWLRRRHLVKEAGWRYIQYCALFFIIWNFVAFTAHFLDEQIQIVQIQRLDSFHIQIQAPAWLSIIYYMAKLDHLMCVPALFFLYLGLKRLLEQPDGNLYTNGYHDRL
jgi:cell division protein FtsW (lipid II flippase)